MSEHFDGRITLESQISYIKGALEQLPEKLDRLARELNEFKKDQASTNSVVSTDFKNMKELLDDLDNRITELEVIFNNKDKELINKCTIKAHEIADNKRELFEIKKELFELKKAFRNRFSWLKNIAISAITAAAVILTKLILVKLV